MSGVWSTLSISSLDTDEEAPIEPVHTPSRTEQQDARMAELDKLAQQTKTRIKGMENFIETLDGQSKSIDEEIKAIEDNVWRRQRAQRVVPLRSTPRTPTRTDHIYVHDTELRKDEVFYRRISCKWNSILRAARRPPILAAIARPITLPPPPGFPDFSELTGPIDLNLEYIYSTPEFRHWSDEKNGREFYYCDINLLYNGVMSLVDLFKRGAVNELWYERMCPGYLVLFPDDGRGEQAGEISRYCTSASIPRSTQRGQRLSDGSLHRPHPVLQAIRAHNRRFPAQTFDLKDRLYYDLRAQTHSLDTSPHTRNSADKAQEAHDSQANIDKMKSGLEELVRLVTEYEVLYKSAQVEAQGTGESGVDVGDRVVGSSGSGKGKERARDV